MALAIPYRNNLFTIRQLSLLPHCTKAYCTLWRAISKIVTDPAARHTLNDELIDQLLTQKSPRAAKSPDSYLTRTHLWITDIDGEVCSVSAWMKKHHIEMVDHKVRRLVKEGLSAAEILEHAQNFKIAKLRYYFKGKWCTLGQLSKMRECVVSQAALRQRLKKTLNPDVFLCMSTPPHGGYEFSFEKSSEHPELNQRPKVL